VVERGLLPWLCGVPGWMVWRAGGDGTARRYCRECGDPLPQTTAFTPL
jgi:hypothetical protein